ncbi:hypothetical protein [Saccharothrix xinjiangensis]|uniref:Transketolase C-terminal domain-containing protein n=1 Tax=Saccharothrix xinjiangensis TaxID=204798 RepID=A0ABV9Y8M8_9PSEU
MTDAVLHRDARAPVRPPAEHTDLPPPSRAELDEPARAARPRGGHDRHVVAEVEEAPRTAEALRRPVVAVCPTFLTRAVDQVLVAPAEGRRVVVRVEDGARRGGVGEGVAEALRAAGSDRRVRVPVLPDEFLPRGSRADVLRLHDRGAAGIARAAAGSLPGSAERTRSGA